MWIHPKDKVQYNSQKFEVEAVEGLYSSGQVKVVLVNSKSKEKKIFSLMEFNKLHDLGEISVKQPTPRVLRNY